MTGPVVVVTGGIGQGLVRAFAARGASVAFCGRSLVEGPPGTLAVVADVTSRDDVRKLWDAAVSQLDQGHGALWNMEGLAEACERALKRYDARRMGVVTPYQPVGDANVVRFFGEIGFEVVHIEGLKCPTVVSIAHVTEDELRRPIRAVDEPDIDAIVQCGTNLSMVRLADEAERRPGKPVVAINAATWWMALRDNDINDKVYGMGSLLRDFQHGSGNSRRRRRSARPRRLVNTARPTVRRLN